MARKRIIALTWFKNSFLPFALYILLHKCQSTTTDMGDSLPVGTSLVGNQTLVSKNGTFALGFFSPQKTNNWYIGIWYAKVSEKTFVWVANRENPVRNIPGVLNLSRDGYLRLFDLRGRLIWSSDNSLKASRASLLESGNLVLLRTRAGKVWESFQHPVDTWLPGMKMRKGMKLTSWKSSSDPAPGPFYLQMDPSPASTQFSAFSHNSGPYWSSGEWNGKYFANMPGFASAGSQVKIVCVTLPPSRMYCTYTTKGMIMEHSSLKKNGELWVYYMIQNGGWMVDAFGPTDQCIVYGVCGANAACIDYTQLNAHVTGNANDTCTCLQGFRPQNSHAWDSQEWWLSGCVRRSPLQCSLTNSTDGFLEVKDKLLADDEAAAYSKEQTLSGCQLACLNNCSCMAFRLSSSSPPVCRLWFGDLMNVHESPGIQSFYLCLAASELQGSTTKPRNKSFGLHILLPGGAAGLVLVLVLVLVVFIMWKRGRMAKEDDVPTSLRAFTFRKLRVATKNFRHKLGKGSFGSVFKGTLADKTLIAVKRLEGLAGTEKQFRAEISTIGEIQHVNLVRLFGFCAEESRRLLVYEYMPNGSLDSFLLRGKEGEVQGKLLSWKTRFQIALGTARGLAYLHDECYLAPEWISGIPITPKADVYSFGMTLLEIIAGRRNVDLTVPQPSCYYFPPWAADQFHKGNLMAIVDGRISGEADAEEVRRAVTASILCIQRDEMVRPTMAQVVQLLQGTVETSAPQFQQSVDRLQDHPSCKQDGLQGTIPASFLMMSEPCT
ncbi:hypothetical protein SUGI_0556690 [Cryptomeria japonica]|nr:hypothetical protein SUGI_0556690 [Cryptomeria japonica]